MADPISQMVEMFLNHALPQKYKRTAKDMERLETVRWLYDGRNRETRQEGRSTWQMIALLEQAMKQPGKPMPIADHLTFIGEPKRNINHIAAQNLKSSLDRAQQSGHPELKKMFRVSVTRGTVTYVGKGTEV